MEKRGVCEGECTEPVAGGITKESTQEAIDGQTKQGCCGERKSCGSDITSQMADAVAQKK